MNFLIFLLPLGGALVVRFFYHNWRAWLVWGITSLVVLFASWLGNFLPISQTVVLIIIVSLLGFVGPEIWLGTRQAVVAILSRPRNWAYIIGFSLFIYSLYNPELLKGLLLLVLVFFGLWVMLRGFGPRRSK